MPCNNSKIIDTQSFSIFLEAILSEIDSAYKMYLWSARLFSQIPVAWEVQTIIVFIKKIQCGRKKPEISEVGWGEGNGRG